MKKNLILFTQLLIVAVSLVIFYKWFLSYKTEGERAYDKELELAEWELHNMEASARQILFTADALLSEFEDSEKVNRIDYASKIFAHYIEGYRIVDGVKGCLQDSLLLKVINLGDGKFLRKVSFLPNTTCYAETFMLDDERGVVILERRDSVPIERRDVEWLEQGKSYINEIVLSTFYKSKILKEDIFEIIQRSSIDSQRMIAIDVSLTYLSKTIKRLKHSESYFVFCDHLDNIVLFASGRDSDFLLTSDVDLRINKVAVKQFIEQTLSDNYFPDEFIPVRVGNETYIGKWVNFSIADKKLKIGYLVGSDYNLLIIYLVWGLIFIAMFLPYVFTLSFSRYKSKIKTTELDNQENLDVDLVESIYKNLIHSFKEDKPYLNAKFSVGLLSEILACDRQVVAKVVAQKKNKTIKELINDYRVKDAAKFMKKDKMARSLSIDLIADRFGYNSRASFHREFKKRTKYSPYEYILLNNEFDKDSK